MTNILQAGYWGILLAIAFMFVFDFSEKVNFVHQFNLPFEMSKRIPLSSILLSLAFLAYLVKVLIEGKLIFSDLPFVRYLIYSVSFLCLSLFVFYPIIEVNYQMGFETDLHLLNKLFKYLLILILATNYLNNEKKLKRLSIGLVSSIVLNAIATLIK